MNDNNPEHPIPTDHESPINSDNEENPKQSTTRSIPIYRKNKTYYYPITFESASSLTHQQQQHPFQPNKSNTPITSSNPKPYISKTSQTKPSSFFIKKIPKQTKPHPYPKIPFSNHTISNCFRKNPPIANVDNNESLSFYPKIRKRIITNQHFHINNCISTSPINDLCNDDNNNCIRKYRSLSNRNIFRRRYENNEKVVIRKEGKNKGITERKNASTKERHLCPFLDIDVIVRKRGNLTPTKSTGSLKKKIFQEESKKIIKKRYFRFLQDKFDKNGDINYDSYNWLFDAMKNHRRRMYDPTNV